MNLQSEKGQALLLAMAAIMVGALVIPAFLGHVGASLRGSRYYSDSMENLYACDAGVEHALWNLVETDVADNLTEWGDMLAYTLDEPINGLTTGVKISNSWETIAWDDFESGDFTGGGGWLEDWTHTGNSYVIDTGSPFEGTYHLMLQGGNPVSEQGYVSRPVDLSKEVGARLRGWARTSSLESGETADCLVSADGADWTVAYTWARADSNYSEIDIDLTPFGLTGTFYIAFRINAGSTGDYFYADDLEIVWLAAEPVQIAEDTFESGNWTGGSGWLYDWTHTGYAGVVLGDLDDPAYEDSWHLRLQGDASPENRGYVARAVDLSAEYIAHLRFWAKAANYAAGDEARCLVSPDGSNWTEVNDWVNGEDTGEYEYFDIDLSGFELTDEFWIAFEADMDRTDETFFVDNVEIVATRSFCITAEAGGHVIKATVELSIGNETVVSWYYL